MKAIIGTMRGQIDCKRFHMPGVKIAIDCQCGRRVEKDLSGPHYLAYPTVGEAFEEIVFCTDCGTETPVRVLLDVTLTAVALQDELLRKPPAKPKLTVKELAQALDEAFEADGWGDIDPYLFKEAAVEDSDHKRDADGLRETLRRAVDKLNARGAL